jgi:hypothetical protein
MINLTDCKVTEFFCIIDDFCKEFSKIEQKSAISDGKRHRNKPKKMSDAEVILILILFHMGGYKCLKHYYIHHICKHCQHFFPKTLSYSTFSAIAAYTYFPKKLSLNLQFETSNQLALF